MAAHWYHWCAVCRQQSPTTGIRWPALKDKPKHHAQPARCWYAACTTSGTQCMTNPPCTNQCMKMHVLAAQARQCMAEGCHNRLLGCMQPHQTPSAEPHCNVILPKNNGYEMHLANKLESFSPLPVKKCRKCSTCAFAVSAHATDAQPTN